MKKFLIHFFVFVGIGSVLYILLSLFSIKASKVYKDGAAIICEAKREAVRDMKFDIDTTKPTVLFMGNSLILSGLIPDEFDSLVSYQYQSLNLSLPALPIGPHYFELKDYLEHEVPDKIILLFNTNVDSLPSMFDYYAIQGMHALEELPSYMVHRNNKTFALNFLLPSQVYDGAILKYLKNSILHPELIEERIEDNQAIINQMIESRGFYFIEHEALFPNNQLPEEYDYDLTPKVERPYVKNPFSDAYTKKFFDLTMNLDIEVLLIAPIVRKGKFKQYKTIPSSLKQVIKKYDHVKIAKGGWKLKYLRNKYFSDERHLNRLGARLYTRFVSKEFLEVYGYEYKKR